MLVDDQYRKCVAFLYADKQDGTRVPVGTAFFVGFTVEATGGLARYVVTANHIVTMSKASGYMPLHVRINTRYGGFEDVVIPEDAWEKDDSNDLAAASMREPLADLGNRAPGLEIVFIPPEVMVEAQIQTTSPKMNPGVGDSVFFMGLFARHPGRVRNQTVARFGNISLLPDEKIKVQVDSVGGTAQVDAYLVEARSHAGHSGSPAFIYTAIDVSTIVGGPTMNALLLGLVQGHFDAPSDIALLGDVGPRQENAGMAVVVPAPLILDLVMTKDRFVKERQAAP